MTHFFDAKRKSYAASVAELQDMIDLGKRSDQPSQDRVRVLRQALSLSKTLLGDGHPKTVACLEFLSDSLAERKEHREALDLVLQAIELGMAADGRWTEPTAIRSSKAAKCYDALGMYEESHRLWSLVASYWEDRCGLEHGFTIYARRRCGLSLLRLNKPQQALLTFQGILGPCRKTFGEHATTLYLLVDIAISLEKLNRYKEALAYWRRVKPMSRNIGQSRINELSVRHSRWCWRQHNKVTARKRNGRQAD